jgi:DNA-binding NarL/FixJ family response regulator
MITVIVADDHVFYRQGIRSLLEPSTEIQVVGEASTGEEAIVRVSSVAPDVILLDIKMPGLDGIDTCRIIGRDHPGTAVVIVTMFDDDDMVVESIRAGARGYVLKDATVDELTRAIHAAHARQGIFSPTISRKLVGLLEPKTEERRPAHLTLREVQVLRFIAEGSTNDQIAARLDITTKTVRNMLSLIYTKISVVDRTQAAIWTRDHLAP